MYAKINPFYLLFIDIETVSRWNSFQEMPNAWKELWTYFSEWKYPGRGPDESFEKSSLYAEFGRIVSISAGHFSGKLHQLRLEIKAFSDPEEKVLLQKFSAFLESEFSAPEIRAVYHHGKEFDIPFLWRRLQANDVPVPALIEEHRLKTADVLEIWKQGEYRHFASLELMARTLGIEPLKRERHSKSVGNDYKNGNLEYIVQNNAAGVETLAQVFLKLVHPNLHKIRAIRTSRG